VTFIRVPAVSPERTPAYEQWYDSVHIPYRMNKPGFLGAQRYETLLGRQRYFVLYELFNAAAAEGKEYLELRRWEASQPADSFEAPGTSRPGFERGIYDQLGGPEWPAAGLRAPIVYVAGHHTPAAGEGAFSTWLGSVYAPALEMISGVVAVRRFALTSHVFGPGTGMHTPYPRLITVSYLDSASVIGDPDFASLQVKARDVENASDREPYVMIGRLVHTAGGATTEPQLAERPQSKRRS
jgi:hypothetical protein